MKLPRRNFLRLAAAAAALPVVPCPAIAQTYPSRPVRLVAGFPGGSAPDLVARLTGQWLSDSLGQPFVIENRPGAASNIATDAVVRSPPDGYTLQMTVLTNVFNTTLYTNLNFVFAEDITHIAGVANAPYVIIVPRSFPAKTLPEFLAYAKANPGKINFASGGRGSSSHIFGELFKAMAGIDIVHVPYRANYMPDLLANRCRWRSTRSRRPTD
jgi:tripartite-type tricarboxylate transporter receptor subunit TctC